MNLIKNWENRGESMKTFADIKKALNVGVTVTMVSHDWFPGSKIIGVKRKIIKRQSNGIQFDGGYWLMYDVRKASDFIPLSESEFQVRLNGDKFMRYLIENSNDVK